MKIILSWVLNVHYWTLTYNFNGDNYLSIECGPAQPSLFDFQNILKIADPPPPRCGWAQKVYGIQRQQWSWPRQDQWRRPPPLVPHWKERVKITRHHPPPWRNLVGIGGSASSSSPTSPRCFLPKQINGLDLDFLNFFGEVVFIFWWCRLYLLGEVVFLLLVRSSSFLWWGHLHLFWWCCLQFGKVKVFNNQHLKFEQNQFMDSG